MRWGTRASLHKHYGPSSASLTHFTSLPCDVQNADGGQEFLLVCGLGGAESDNAPVCIDHSIRLALFGFVYVSNLCKIIHIYVL